MSNGIGAVLGGLAHSAGSALADADWGSIAGQVAGVGAPILGSLLGGVVGGPAGAALGNQAGKLIASALGVAPTPQAVSQALQDDPAAVEKIKQLEMAHADDLEEIKARLLDTQNARAMETTLVQAGSNLSWFPPILTIVIVLGFFANVGVLYFLPRDVPPNILQLLYLVFGIFSTAFTGVLNYWFGTSRSSETNGAMVRSIAGATTGAAVPSEPTGRMAAQPKSAARKPLSRSEV